MNLPILQSEVKTMSSREIATLCEKEHKNVIRDIRNMLDSLDGSLLNHEYYQILTDERGYTSEILLNENLSINLVTGYNPTLRLRMVQHWQELRKPKELSRMELIELAMQAERERIALENKVEQLQPKADAYEILSGAKGSVSIRVASGELKVPEKKFIQWLLDNDWAYREGNRTDGKLLPHAHRKEQGYLELVSVVTYNTGEAVARSQTKVTQKGLARLAQIFSKNRALLTHKISSNEVTA
jgi:phage antirepressor YoqD-like protein